MSARRRFPEWELQKDSAQLMAVALATGAFAFHVPNERGSGLQRQILAGGGVRPGVADWIILAPWYTQTGQRVGRAFALELKAPGRVTTASQNDFARACDVAGVPYAVRGSLEDIADTLSEWGLLRPGVHL